jgi:hypothetical protein
MFQLLSVLAITLFALTGCSDRLDRPLHFELPSDYTGPLLLIEQPDARKVLSKTPDEYRIVVPTSGVLRLGDAWVLHRWHTTRASFSSGAPIPIPSTSGVGFHAGPYSTSDNRIYHNWFFVGDYAAAQDFFNGRDSISRQTEWLNQHNVE